MSRKKIFIYIILITLFCTTPGYANLFEKYSFEEYNMEQQGQLNIFYSYFITDNEDMLENSNDILGSYFDYNSNLNGRIFDHDMDNRLSYRLIKTPGEDQVDWGINLTTPHFSFQKNDDINLDFENIELGFAQSGIDGYEFHTTERDITIFSGEESYIPMFITIPVIIPGQSKFNLFECYAEKEIPPSGGDILKYSDVIMVDGKVLKRREDYTINYLSGDVRFNVPLTRGNIIEAKFQFIPTDEDLSISGEKIEGVVFDKQWLESGLTYYNFRRGQDRNRVQGLAANITQGPVTFKGEWATSKQKSSDEEGVELPPPPPPVSLLSKDTIISEDETKAFESAEANYIDFRLAEGPITIKYGFNKIQPDFEEIGINSYSIGTEEEFNMTQKIEEDYKLELDYHKKTVEDMGQKTVNSTKKGIFDYKQDDVHTYQIIVREQRWKKDGQFGLEKRRESDIAYGYNYDNNIFNFGYQQYLSNTDDRMVEFGVDNNGFSMGSKYYVQPTFEGQEHKVEGVLNYRPLKGWSINSLLDYNRSFEADKGDLRLINNTRWSLNRNLTTTGQYVFFNVSEHESTQHRYKLGLNYHPGESNSNLEYVKTDLESATAKSSIEEVGLSANIKLHSMLWLNYNGDYESFEQQGKLDETIHDGDSSTVQNLGFDLFATDYIKISPAIKNTLIRTWYNSWSPEGYEMVYDKRTKNAYSLGVEFNDLKRRIVINAEYEPAAIEEVLTAQTNVDFTLWDFKLKGNSNTEYSINQDKALSSVINYNLTLPDIYKIIPSISAKTEYTDKKDHTFKETYSAKISYNFDEEKSIFIKLHQKTNKNWNNADENYISYGISSGLGLEF